MIEAGQSLVFALIYGKIVQLTPEAEITGDVKRIYNRGQRVYNWGGRVCVYVYEAYRHQNRDSSRT